MRRFERPIRPWRRVASTTRRAAAGLAVGGVLLIGTAATAAPTCLDSSGATVRCEARGARPAAATPAPEPRANPGADIPLPSAETLFGLVCVVGGLFVLIGLMPDFDGWGPGEHDGRREPD